MVREEGLEPTRLATLDPKSSASANFATRAQRFVSPLYGDEPSLPYVFLHFVTFEQLAIHCHINTGFRMEK
jgi:hypothetical protein